MAESTTKKATARAASTKAKTVSMEAEETVSKTAEAAPVKEQSDPTLTKAKMFSEDDVKALIAEALKAKEQELVSLAQRQAAAQPVVMQVKQDDMVTLLFLGAIAQGTVVTLGTLGQINRAGGTIDVPKSAFFQGLTYTVEQMLQNRKLIVVNGLTDEERERFGVKYRDGELLSANNFYRLLDLDVATLKDIYPKLCEEHQRMIATMFITAYEKDDVRVNMEKVKALNKISKKLDKDGLFTPIVQSLNDKNLND